MLKQCDMASKYLCKFNETLQSEFKFIKKVEKNNDYDVYCTIFVQVCFRMAMVGDLIDLM